MELYKKTYYNFYRCFDRIGSNNDPAFKASVYFSLWKICWLWNLLLISDLFKMDFYLGNPRLVGILTGVTIIAVDYFVFVHKDRYQEIESYFKHTTRQAQKTKRWIVIANAFLPFLILWVLIYFNWSIRYNY